MARKTASRLELRKQAEAAEARKSDEDDDEVEDVAESDDDSGDDESPKKKKATKKKPTATRAKRTKTKAVTRRKLVWGVFSSSMKEEGRFPYQDREAAEQKMEALKLKNKREYFIQPIKEPIADAPAPAAEK